MTDPRIVIAIVPKNLTDEVRVSLNRFNHHDLIDVRTFTEPRTGGSERIATKAGISLRIEALPALITALVRAQLAAVQAGILAPDSADDCRNEAERPG